MDMLIPLYALPAGAMPPPEVTIRKPIAPEHDLITAWVARHFSAGWASEARAALAKQPVSLFVATRGEPAELLGFCAYDATARGFVGPIGVLEAARRSGVGAALLHACLQDMRAVGYGYAVAGAVGAPAFFRRTAQAVDIAGSQTGLYRGMLRGVEPEPSPVTSGTAAGPGVRIDTRTGLPVIQSLRPVRTEDVSRLEDE